MMKKVVIPYLICLLLAGCVQKKMAPSSVFPAKPALKIEAVATQYTAQLDLRGNVLNGILMVKKSGNGTHVIFVSHFGLTVFDVEILTDTMKINQCPEALQNRRALALLEQDLRSLTTAPNNQTFSAIFTDNDKKHLTFGKGVLKGRMVLGCYSDDYPELITIAHRALKIYWHITY
jgi:hypothetical protein